MNMGILDSNPAEILMKNNSADFRLLEVKNE